MKVFRFINVIDDYAKFLKQKNYNSKRISLHIFKSDFLVRLAVILTIKLFFLLARFFFFRRYNDLDKYQKIHLFKLSSIFFNFFLRKIDELILAVVLIQSENFNEKTKVENFKENTTKFEHIVVGSGPSGAITAYNLQKNFKNTLIIERGRKFTNYKTKHPGDEFLFKWTNGGINRTIFKNHITFSSGSCFGGGSEINSGLFHFPDKNYVENWKNNFNVKKLDYKSLLKFTFKALKICKISKSFSKKLTSSSFFKIGAEKNSYEIEKISRFGSYFKKKFLRNTMSSTFLKRYIKLEGKLVTKSFVNKIIFRNNLWNIETLRNNKIVKYQCKYLFLCCGALDTAKILILSKIKTKKKLHNFFFHPMIKAVVEFKKDVQEGTEDVHSYQITEFFPDFIIGEAAGGKRFIELSGIMNNLFKKKVAANWKKMAMYHVTFSLGTGKLYKIPFTNQFLHFYSIDEKNLELFRKGYLILCKTLFAGGAKKINLITKNILSVSEANYEKKIKNIKNISEFNISAVHLLGGINSGENKTKCVVDSFGKFLNYKNLYINDSSLINHKLLKNPQGLIMALSQRNVENFILNK